jgi:hypothetical protein
MSTDEICNAILEVENKDVLDRILQALSSRRAALSAQLAGELRIGDKVRVTSIKPKYLEGETGTVAAPPIGMRIPIRLDHPEAVASKYVNDEGIVHVPANCVALVSRAADQPHAGGDAGE